MPIYLSIFCTHSFIALKRSIPTGIPSAMGFKTKLASLSLGVISESSAEWIMPISPDTKIEGSRQPKMIKSSPRISSASSQGVFPVGGRRQGMNPIAICLLDKVKNCSDMSAHMEKSSFPFGLDRAHKVTLMRHVVPKVNIGDLYNRCLYFPQE